MFYFKLIEYILKYTFFYKRPWSVEENSKEPWNKEYFYNDILKSTDSINELGTIVWPIFYCYALS